MRDLVNYTPPRKAGSGNVFKEVAPQSQRKQGQLAVSNDINRMFQPLKKLEAIYNPREKKWEKFVRIMLRTKQYKELAKILYINKILTFRPVILEEADAALHKRFRVRSTGRVSQRVKNPWLVVKERSIETLKKKLQANVGTSKSGWVKALRGKVNE